MKRLKKIGIIGCGIMGQSIIARLASLGKHGRIVAVDKDHRKTALVERRFAVKVTGDIAHAASGADVVILAVKPQDMDEVLRGLIGVVSERTLLVSIAAGVTTRHIESVFGRVKVPVIRVMPNMPAVIGEAISAISAGRYARASQRTVAKEVLSSIGETVEVAERRMDAVTAVSGSGPAYFYYLIESMIEAASALGLEHNVAERLVVKTALGSVHLLSILREEASRLRRRVASKGGTTEAALKVFESRRFKETIRKAMERAARRSRELSQAISDL